MRGGGGTQYDICIDLQYLILSLLTGALYVAILLGMLKKREEAARHYISFLKQLKAWKELHTLYA